MIRLARENEYELVRAFYHGITDELENSLYGPGWKKDIYPDQDMV